MQARRVVPLALLAMFAGCPHRSPYAIDGDGGMDGEDGGRPDRPDARPPGMVVDAASTPDGRPGTGIDAGSGPGGIAEFPPCTSDSECAAGSDCRTIPWIGSEKQCIPRCDSTSDCPFNTYCYPTGGGALGPAFALMGDHCWFSLCGEAFGSASETNGLCQLGQEAGVPAGDQRPGWCMSIDDQSYGQCLEAGTVGPGGACDFLVQTRGGNNCDATSICIGDSGSPTGTCRQRCAPEQILAGGATGCTLAGQECLDLSSVNTYNDGSVGRATFGYCDTVEACGLISLNTCGPTPSGEAQGCVQTNPLRPTGFCDPTGMGSLPAGAMCMQPPPPTESGRCWAGSICTAESGSSSTCQTVCKVNHACMVMADCPPAMNCSGGSVCTLPYYTGPDASCPPGSMCTALLYGPGFDDTFDTPDDVYTYDWGTCQ